MTTKSAKKQELLQETLVNNSGKNVINLSPKKIADPINKNLKDRYQELIEEEDLDGVSVWESNEIIKQLDKGEDPTKIDINKLTVDDPNQKILGILPLTNLTISENGKSFESWLFSPIPIALILVCSGIFLFKKQDSIYELLLGENRISYKIIESLGLGKPQVSETAIFLHNRAIKDAKVLAKSAQILDEDKFSKKEFLLFAKIKFCVQYDRQEYEGLKHSIELFKSAIKAQKSYVIIAQIESMCQGSKQKEFYHYVYQELKKIDDPQIFNDKINQKLTEILPEIKTEEGRHNLQTYAEELARLSQNMFSLQLFSWFSQKQLKEFSILKSINEIITTLKEQDVVNLKALTCLVMVHYDDFECLGQIINVTGKKSSPDTYARIIQYIGLEERHQKSYDKFQQFMNIMGQWYPLYQAIRGIREEYPEKDYRRQKDFTKEIPGIELYHKYRNYLTDKKTGYTYVDFGEEMSTVTVSSKN